MARGKTAASTPERIKAVLCDPTGPREIELVKTDDGRWVDLGLAERRARGAWSSLGKTRKKNILIWQDQEPWLLAEGPRARRFVELVRRLRPGAPRRFDHAKYLKIAETIVATKGLSSTLAKLAKDVAEEAQDFEGPDPRHLERILQDFYKQNRQDRYRN
jgi:hypothetical protein